MEPRSDNYQNNITICFQTYKSHLWRITQANIDNRLLQHLDIEDVLQDLYLEIIRNEQYMSANSQIPFIIKARHLLIELLGKLSRRYLKNGWQEVKTVSNIMGDNYDFFEELMGSITSPSQSLIKIENREIIGKIWVNLHPIDREILYYRYFEQLSNKECAALLHISEGTASARLVRALSRLETELSNYPEFNSEK